MTNQLLLYRKVICGVPTIFYQSSVSMSQSKTPAPTPTNNSLADVVNWVKQGWYVVLTTYDGKTTFRYHNCKSDTLGFIQITVDVALLSEGEWPWHIENHGKISKCSCDTKIEKYDYVYRLQS
jgi:hypothetical protein